MEIDPMEIDRVDAGAQQARLAAKLAAVEGESAATDERRASHAAASTPGGRSCAEKLTSLCLEAVRDTVGEIFKRMPLGQCANCGAMAPVMKRCCPCPSCPKRVRL